MQMEALLETLNARLHVWKPETADAVRERVREIISLADQDAVNLRSRARRQEVLDSRMLLPRPGEVSLAYLCLAARADRRVVGLIQKRRGLSKYLLRQTQRARLRRSMYALSSRRPKASLPFRRSGVERRLGTLRAGN